MRGQHFRLMSPTIAILYRDGRRTAVTIPAGTIIAILSDSGAEDALARVECQGELYEMFIQDIRERGEAIERAAG